MQNQMLVETKADVFKVEMPWWGKHNDSGITAKEADWGELVGGAGDTEPNKIIVENLRNIYSQLFKIRK